MTATQIKAQRSYISSRSSKASEYIFPAVSTVFFGSAAMLCGWVAFIYFTAGIGAAGILLGLFYGAAALMCVSAIPFVWE